MLTLKVYISSPGDVQNERFLARRSMARIKEEAPVAGKINFREISWDNPNLPIALNARLPPQDAVNDQLPTPSDCDIVIIVLWSRLGTPLPPKVARPDGKRFQSGTEWEFHNALKGSKENSNLKVWLYRCAKRVPTFSGEQETEEIQTQHKRVINFFELSNEDGSQRHAYHTFTTASEFAYLLEGHLRTYVWQRLQSEQLVSSNATPSWDKNPYVGLRAYTDAEAEIFYGRDKEADDLVELFSQEKSQILIVIGSSGSGKSSLVWAGLIPRVLAHHATMEIPLEFIRFCPGDTGNDPVRSLALALTSHTAFIRHNSGELTSLLKENAHDTCSKLRHLWEKHNSHAGILIFIDQFEEVFLDTVDPSDRKNFVSIVDVLCKLEFCRIIITVRSEFYDQLIQFEPLETALQSYSYHLGQPSLSAIHEMIERPAVAAGLDIETKLLDILKHQVGSEQGGLALMAFLLEQLVDIKVDETLTLSDYNSIGGIEGVINKQAESAIEGKANDRDLSVLFDSLVMINSRGIATRRSCRFSELNNHSLNIVNSLINKRILLSTSDKLNNGTFQLAHESVLLHWHRLNRWIQNEENKEFIFWRSKISNHLDLYKNKIDEPGYFLQGKMLSESRRWAEKTNKELTEKERELVNQSTDARRRKRRNAGLGFLIVGMALAACATLYQHIIQLPIEPKLVKIPAGSFRMGAGDDDMDATNAELPARKVRIDHGFEISSHEITFEEFDIFARASDRLLPEDGGFGRDAYPVVNVSFNDATNYATWLSEKTNRNYRLPTEIEWEYAARAGLTAPRPWAVSSDACTYANVFDLSAAAEFNERYPDTIQYPPHECTDTFVEAAPAGATNNQGIYEFTANSFGAYQMLGNVWEWVSDCWHESYDGAPDHNIAWIAEGDCEKRVVRGGSWLDSMRDIRYSSRHFMPRDRKTNALGFRLVLDTR